MLQEKLKGWMQYPAFKGTGFNELGTFIAKERQQYTLYPEKDNIFRAFELTPPEEVKVVILGHQPASDGTATGLAFECGDEVSASWKKVIAVYDKDFPRAFNPDVWEGKLEAWAKQGVLLLNSALTSRKTNDAFIYGKQWSPFTGSILQSLVIDQSPKVFIILGIWAKYTLECKCGVNISPHKLIYADHPAKAVYDKKPWDAEGIFLKANEYLKSKGITQIDW